MTDAIARAQAFLLARQDPDGGWRDYLLAPGRSEAWTTAVVACALQSVAGQHRLRATALERAAAFHLATRRPGGWGYNRHTACDADSSAWTLRCLAGQGMVAADAAALFLRYRSATGHVRTFDSVERFGHWAAPHDEVAPLVGLALLAHGDHAAAAALRPVLIAAWEANGWQPYWWQGDAYVRTQNLEFLAASGGIPPHIAQTESAHLHAAPPPTTAFDLAQQLSSALLLDATERAHVLAAALLQSQMEDGGWPPSLVLLVPQQWQQGNEVFDDDRRMMSTAVVLTALNRMAAGGKKMGSGARVAACGDAPPANDTCANRAITPRGDS